MGFEEFCPSLAKRYFNYARLLCVELLVLRVEMNFKIHSNIIVTRAICIG